MKTFREFMTSPSRVDTLYVHRNLINSEDVIKWHKENLNCSHLKEDDFHVTIAFSREEVEWSQFEPLSNPLKVKLKNVKPEKLGEQGAIVLRFECDELGERWKEFKAGGASWDYPSYKPHLTLSYSYPGTEAELRKVKGYTGTLEFGPEVFGEVEEDWAAKIEEEEFGDV